jgi:molybdopterin-synthase adenylyltransferase
MNKRQEFYVSITSADWQSLRHLLLTEDCKENAAVLLCGISETKTETRLLVRKIVDVPHQLYDAREKLHLRISPRFYNEIVTECSQSKLSPVIIHSHPFEGEAEYSRSDDYGESRLLPVLSSLLTNAIPASLLITKTSVSGRRFMGDRFTRLTGLKLFGPKAQIMRFSKSEDASIAPQFERQTQAFGEEGQRVIQSIKVGIIGVGGIGSLVGEQLARVGIRDLIVIDNDTIEASNVSRIIGSTLEDLGKHKALVVGQHLHSLGASNVKQITDSAIRQEVLLQLRDRDLIFNCVDNDRTRAIINRFSHQYLIPIIDLGTRLDARKGEVTAAAGRVSIIGNDLTCLRCSHHLNPERIRAESMPAEERSKLVKEGYVMGIDEPVPSVISINTVVAGLGVTSGLNLFIGLTGSSEVAGQIYDATSGFVFTTDPVHEPGCDVCDPTVGLKGLGDLQIVSAY